MPNLQAELDDLQLADKHVLQAEAALARLENAKANGVPFGETEQTLLDAARESLVQFRKHRDLIVQTIADIRAGRLPST
jgi:hypothetical protein